MYMYMYMYIHYTCTYTCQVLVRYTQTYTCTIHVVYTCTCIPHIKAKLLVKVEECQQTRWFKSHSPNKHPNRYIRWQTVVKTWQKIVLLPKCVYSRYLSIRLGEKRSNSPKK